MTILSDCVNVKSGEPFQVALLLSFVSALLNLAIFGPPSLHKKSTGEASRVSASGAVKYWMQMGVLALSWYGLWTDVRNVYTMWSSERTLFSNVTCGTVTISMGGFGNFWKAFALYNLYMHRDQWVSFHKFAAGACTAEEYQFSGSPVNLRRIIGEIYSVQGPVIALYIGSMVTCYAPFALFVMLFVLLPCAFIFAGLPMLLISALMVLIVNPTRHCIEQRYNAQSASDGLDQNLVPLRPGSVNPQLLAGLLVLSDMGAMVALTQDDMPKLYAIYEKVQQVTVKTGSTGAGWRFYVMNTIMFAIYVPFVVTVTARFYLDEGWWNSITTTVTERSIGAWVGHLEDVSARLMLLARVS